MVTPAGKLLSDGPRIRVRIVAGDRVIEGEGLIDTGAGFSVVDTALGFRKLDAVEFGCLCGAMSEAPMVDCKIDIGARWVAPVAVPLERVGVVAIVGRDLLVGRTFVYDGHTGTFEIHKAEKAA